MAVDAQHVYWADTFGGVLGRAGIRGESPETTYISGSSEPCGVAVDDSYIYWANRSAGTIGRARLDGSEVNQNFVSGLGQPCGVAVNASHVYWTDLKHINRIGRADIDGTSVDTDFIEAGACGVAVDSEHIFWSTLDESIGRANLDGSMVEDDFITGLERPCGVAVEGTRIFWAEQRLGNGTVGTANVDGSSVNRDLVTDLHELCGVATDATAVVPPPPRPQAHVRFGRVRHNYRKAFLSIPVRFPAWGKASLTTLSRGLNIGFLPGQVASVHLDSGQTRWLKISITPPGRRLLRQLQHRGRIKVAFRLSYLEEGQFPVSTTKSVVLRGRPSQR